MILEFLKPVFWKYVQFFHSEESTRGHLIIVMLAHMILRELRHAWQNFNKTVAEALTELSYLCRNIIQFSDGHKINCIPTPNDSMMQLLTAANVVLPKSIEEWKVPVSSRTKVRKSVKN